MGSGLRFGYGTNRDLDIGHGWREVDKGSQWRRAFRGRLEGRHLMIRVIGGGTHNGNEGGATPRSARPANPEWRAFCLGDEIGNGEEISIPSPRPRLASRTLQS